MKSNSLELTEFIKENYPYNSSQDFYNIKDIILLTDYLLKNDSLKRGDLLEMLEELKKQ